MALLKVTQRGTAEGEYVDTDIWDAGKPCYKNFDCDIAAFVYPKWIKVISGTEVITASVNFNEGGGSGSGSVSKIEFVDLGLPSGTLWATTNVGATKPEDFGLYFAWGETEGYEGITDEKQFSWADYELCDGSDTTLIKYNDNSSYGTVDTLTTLEQVDDAAYTSDNTCRMPTKADLEELTANTTSTWETLNGVNGMRFTGTNGNSIFVPATGNCNGGSVNDVGSDGGLWSSSLGESDSRVALVLLFGSDYMFVPDYYRFIGLPVRAVKNK